MENFKLRLSTAYRKLAPHVKLFWPGFAAGILYFGYIFWFLWDLYPLSSIGISSNILSAFIILFQFIGSVVSAALFWGIFSWLILRLVREIKNFFLFTGAAAGAFVIIEYLRSWIFGIVWVGAGSVLGPHWPWGNLAYWTVEIDPVFQSASLWGIYGVTFLIALIGMAVFWCIHHKLVRVALGSLVILAVALGVSDYAWETRVVLFNTSATMPITIIQTQRPPTLYSAAGNQVADFKEKLKLLDGAKDSFREGELVILPEGASFTATLAKFANQPDLESYFKKLAPAGAVFIDDVQVGREGKTVSQVVAFDSQRGFLGGYQKHLLMPWGEFLPYVVELPLRIINFFSPGISRYLNPLTPGDNQHTLTLYNEEISILACSDLIAPSADIDPDTAFIVATQSLAPLHGSPHIQRQLLAMARFRAVENRKFLVLASNTATSHIISDSGKITAQTQKPGYEILTGTVVPRTKATWYNKLGDFPILAISFAFFGVALREHPLWKRNRKYL